MRVAVRPLRAFRRLPIGTSIGIEGAGRAGNSRSVPGGRS
jgi:hypothetical protein